MSAKSKQEHDAINDAFAQRIISEAAAASIIKTIPPGYHAAPVLDAINGHIAPTAKATNFVHVMKIGEGETVEVRWNFSSDGEFEDMQVLIDKPNIIGVLHWDTIDKIEHACLASAKAEFEAVVAP